MIDVVVIGGGQSGLAAARTLTNHGLRSVVLEAGPETVGSWPHYYDSLKLFSPGQHSGMSGMEFPGDPDHYPHRDEVVEYLRRYSSTVEADIRTNTPVTAVTAHDETGFVVHTSYTLRGVHRDAEHVVGALAAYVRDAPAAVGL